MGLLAATIALVVASVVIAAAPAASPDPCNAATAPLTDAGAAALGTSRRAFDSYRAGWRRACAANEGPADVGGLVADAEALVADVKLGRAVSALVDALPSGARWPVPGVRRDRGVDEGLDVDWSAIAAMTPRASVEDARAMRGLTRAEGPDGEPIWLEPGRDGARGCVRLAETDWVEVSSGILDLQAAQNEVFARRASSLRERLLATLKDLSRGTPVCACTRGDPLRSLDLLAGGKEKLGTPEHRALVAAATDAAKAVRTGAARVSFLREAPGAPATGCALTP
ncbi:MAG TPA: hypothetical protein VF875_07485 [Anaeromyxobacter sp.]